MEQSTTLLTILESLISEEDIQAIIDKHKYQEVARKFTVKALVHMFVMAAANEWKSFRHSADVATSYGLPAVNYSTFSKKASTVSYAIVKDVFQLLLSRMNRWMRRSFSFPKELLLIDSTTITVGKTRLPWAPYHGERAGIKLHVTLSETTEIPHKVVETTGLKHDGPLMSEFVNPQFILVADRAYFKIERVDDYVKTERQPVKENA
ncbi:transposase [Aneurinibacillus aneurinilyticus]|uniref:transposase n=1 Tax=Aneurinibacillus aneurinilyticus TaxID=1391 RepID=UPI0035255ED1